MNEEIVKHYKEMKIGIDEPFKFHCTLCGECCIHREDILLNAKDLFRIAKKLELTPHEVAAEYCETYIGPDSRLPIVRLNPRGPENRCPLLKNCKCMVHDSKPTVCAMFPIGRYMESEASNQSTPILENLKTGKTGYIYVNPECGDDTETHTVREWFNRFGIPLEDSYFANWNRILVGLSSIFHGIEKKLPKKSMEQIWTASFISLYFNYDIHKNFFPQFCSNTEKLMEVMRAFAENTVNENQKAE
ncbi:MAG: YkgJ family cysteine cluster protein [Eubacteriales bacterium]|nr:YkgJ family cysteine cluster protein [Eubacteriales bacterium]